ncbi:MAG: flagellar biosynthetic protein FliR [Firmicutes bacterium]|nr:flagellar biosynthetic protein FliR [Bacillota bacterium]
MEVSLTDFVAFMLALIRLTTFFAVIPLFSMRNVPLPAKIGLAALFSLAVRPSFRTELDLESLSVLAVLSLQEVAVGLVLGLVVILVFAIVTFAGHYTDTPLGFGMASVFDPSLGGQIPVFSQFYHIVAALVFFGADAHLWLLQAFSRSFSAIPFGRGISAESSFALFMDLTQQIFSIGLRIALPIVATILLTDIGLGIVIRAVPQINVFVLGFPVKIAVGLLVAVFAIPAVVVVISQLFALDGLLFSYFYKLLGLGGS